MPSRDEYLAAKVRSWATPHVHGNPKPAADQTRKERPASPPPADLSNNMQQRRIYFKSLLHREMEWHGLLPRWSVAFDNCRTRAGVCDFHKARLSFSRHLVARAKPHEMRNTILHEIAHALAGPRHGHDAQWRRIALRIGCDGRRCHDMQLAKPRWLYCCSGGCWQERRFKRSAAGGRACKACGAVCIYTAAPGATEPTYGNEHAASNTL